MYDYPVSLLVQLTLETAAFLVIVAVGLSRRREGPWAVLATVGGVLALVVAALQLTVYAEAKFLHSSHVVDFVFAHTERFNSILSWTRVAGLVLIAAAFVARPRRPATEPRPVPDAVR